MNIVLMRKAVWLMAILLTGCQSASMNNIALPSAEQLTCCWQSQELVSISGEGIVESIQLNAVVLRLDDRLLIVLMDSFGQKLASIEQQGDKVTKWQSPQVQRGLPLGLLSLAVYFTHLDNTAWTGLWSVDHSGNRKSLYYRKRLLITLEQDMVNGDFERSVYFANSDTKIGITSIAYTDLSATE